MKILYLVHQFYPDAYQGTEKFVLQLAQHCQAAGHEVKVITYSTRARNGGAATTVAARPLSSSGQAARQRTTFPAFRRFKAHVASVFSHVGISAPSFHRLRAFGDRLPNRIFRADYEYQGVPVISFCHRQHPAYLRQQLQDPSLTRFAQELIQREQPDLIHVGHPMQGAEFLYAAQAQQIPYLLTLTDFWLICWRCNLLNEQGQLCHGPRLGNECRMRCTKVFPPAHVEQRRQLAQHLLTQAGAVVAPSHFLASKIRAEYATIPIRLIPYGMDTQSALPNGRRYPSAKPLTFLFAGGLFKSKGIDLLIAAFRRLTSAHIRLQIYGAGTLLTAIQQAVQADDRIRYGGVYQIHELNQILTQVDVVIVPSTWYENMPLIMQEAQASGVPTLVADVGGMTECVTDEVNGFTFRMGDVADLQRKMQMIIDQPAILNGIKENIRNPQPGEYRVTSLAEEAKLYLEQYERIVRKSP